MRPVLPVLADLTSWLTRGVSAGPQPGSLLASQIEKEHRADDQRATASSEAIVVLTWSACGHLDGLRRLLGAKDEVPHPHALVSLARGAIENAALAAWLADSEISADERNRRFTSYQHHGLTEHAKLGVNTGGFDQIIDTLEATSKSHGWRLVLPSKTQLVAHLFGDEEMDPGDAFGAFGYRVHSAIAHGSFHTLLEFFHPVGDESGVVGASGEQAFTLCVLPATSAIQLLGYQLVSAYGLSEEEWREIIRRCQEVDVRHLMNPKS